MAELEGLGFMVVPFWEELVHTPVFFGKSAEGIESKELGGKNLVYGKWKGA